MTTTLSDALVFFGVTGDLAYEHVFPALQVMVRRGQSHAAKTEAEALWAKKHLSNP